MSEREQLGRAPMNEFRSELDRVRDTLIAHRPNASANPLARLEDARSNPALLEGAHCREARHPGPHNCDVASDDGHCRKIAQRPQGPRGPRGPRAPLHARDRAYGLAVFSPTVPAFLSRATTISATTPTAAIAELTAHLLDAERVRSERILNGVRAVVLLLLAAASALYSAQLTLSLNRVNAGESLPAGCRR